MSTYTHTSTYTRARAVIDQVSVLYSEAGIDETRTARVCRGVENRWLDAVGLFLERHTKLVYEVAAEISWSAHSDLAELEFSADLPGWEKNGSPEAIILGRRFADTAKRHALSPRYWVRFTAAIRADQALYRKLSAEVGVSGSLPDWADSPRTTSLPLQDLSEISLFERTTL